MTYTSGKKQAIETACESDEIVELEQKTSKQPLQNVQRTKENQD